MEVGKEVKRIDPADEYADGIWVRMNGRREYLLPALSFGTLKAHGAAINGMGSLGEGVPGPEHVATLAIVVHSALKKNYPDVKIEEVEEWVTLANFREIFSALMSVSGLEREDPPPGGPKA